MEIFKLVAQKATPIVHHVAQAVEERLSHGIVPSRVEVVGLEGLSGEEFRLLEQSVQEERLRRMSAALSGTSLRRGQSGS